MNKWLKFIQPRSQCALCGVDMNHGLFCPACHDELRHSGASCHRCALPLPRDGICGECQSHPPCYDRSEALFPYRWPLDRLISRMKFSGQLHLARGFGVLLGEHMRRQSSMEAIIAVPAHATRLLERGYNQAAEIARHAARCSGRTFLGRALIRSRATPAQTTLDAATRRRNLRDAFAVPAAAAADIAGRDLAIIDDVMTTGSTVNEIARTLKRAGARRVEVWVVARAPHPG